MYMLPYLSRTEHVIFDKSLTNLISKDIIIWHYTISCLLLHVYKIYKLIHGKIAIYRVHLRDGHWRGILGVAIIVQP